MRASMAYFAGVGTIAAAIAIGIGGGLIAGNIMNPRLPKDAAAASKLERRAATDTAGASAAAAFARIDMLASDPVPYLSETQRAGFGPLLTSTEPQANSAQSSAQTSAANGQSENASPAQPRSTEQQASSDKASPENAYARAKDSDVKRGAAERRRAERHQRWAERHRRDWREQADPGDVDRRDVDRRAREDADARDDTARPPYGLPHIRLFGDDD